MFCKNCGKQIDDNAKFCIECGTKVEKNDVDTAAQAETDLINDNIPSEENLFGTSDITSAPEELSSADTTGSESFSGITENTDDSFAADIADTFSSAADETVSEEISSADSFDTSSFLDDTPSVSEEPVFSESLSDTSADALTDTAADSVSDDIVPEIKNDDLDLDFASSLDTSSDIKPEDEPSANEDITNSSLINESSDIPLDISDNSAETTSDNISVPEHSSPLPPLYPQNNNAQTGQIPPAYPQDNGQQFAPGGAQQQPYFDEQPVQEQPAEEEKTVKIGAGRIFGATLVTIFTFVFMFSLSLLCAVKFGASGKTLEKSIKRLDSKTVLSAEFDDDDLSSDIYKTLGIRSITNGEADKESFRNYLEKTDILDFVGSRVRNYADYILEGKGDDPSVTADEITDEFFGSKENNRVAKEELGMKFSSSQLKNINKKLIKHDVEKNLSVKEWKDEAGFDIKTINYGFSYITIGIIAALVLVFLIWIAVIVDRRGKHLTGFYYYIFGISGVLMLIIGAAILAVSPILYAITSNVIFYLIFHVLLKFGIISACIGVGELFFAFIFRAVRKGIKRKERTAKIKAEALKE